MLAMEAVREIMRIKDVRPAELYNKLGIASNAFCNRMQQKNVSTAVLNEMVKPLGTNWCLSLTGQPFPKILLPSTEETERFQIKKPCHSNTKVGAEILHPLLCPFNSETWQAMCQITKLLNCTCQ